MYNFAVKRERESEREREKGFSRKNKYMYK